MDSIGFDRVGSFLFVDRLTGVSLSKPKKRKEEEIEAFL